MSTEFPETRTDGGKAAGVYITHYTQPVPSHIHTEPVTSHDTASDFTYTQSQCLHITHSQHTAIAFTLHTASDAIHVIAEL